MSFSTCTRGSNRQRECNKYTQHEHLYHHEDHWTAITVATKQAGCCPMCAKCVGNHRRKIPRGTSLFVQGEEEQKIAHHEHSRNQPTTPDRHDYPQWGFTNTEMVGTCEAVLKHAGFTTNAGWNLLS
eukprot:TRINITY_DN4793_c0_g1_i1.p2 TRINITY_DN4793_c0_g1~~TRINITY_DN4793_c0_g1_i1.p2  ORF type:complete len:127 (-),score=4.91 TRINITY_DN4793_c0_g1_i1:307-687(-)